jgi:hypothetical protein
MSEHSKPDLTIEQATELASLRERMRKHRPLFELQFSRLVLDEYDRVIAMFNKMLEPWDVVEWESVHLSQEGDDDITRMNIDDLFGRGREP